MHSPAYWSKDTAPQNAKDSGVFAAIQHAGPWIYHSHPHGGTLAIWQGEDPSLHCYGEPREASDGLWYYPPKELPTIYDLVRPVGVSGTDVQLACGVTVTIPVALVAHRQLMLGGANKGKYGSPITEYGRLATAVLDYCKVNGGIADSDPRLLRLMVLAISQRYRVTAELIDDLGLLAAEDVDPILGAAWCGDPKAGAPASDGAGNASPTSVSTGANSVPLNPNPGLIGQLAGG